MQYSIIWSQEHVDMDNAPADDCLEVETCEGS